MRLELVEVRGSGAQEFLHRVTAGTVKSVQVGFGRAGLLLNGQSRMIAQFDLLRVEPTRFLLAAPTSCAQALLQGLENLHFSEDLTISNTTISVGAESQEGNRAEDFPVKDFQWQSAIPGFRFSPGGAENPVGFEEARIAALVPRPPFEWSENTPALEAGMLPWIDRYKGCYPGQEVVELSLNVGHPARVLVAVKSEALLEAGKEISWDGIDVPITSSSGQCAIVRVPWAKKDFVPAGFTRLKSQF